VVIHNSYRVAEGRLPAILEKDFVNSPAVTFNASMFSALWSRARQTRQRFPFQRFRIRRGAIDGSSSRQAAFTSASTHITFRATVAEISSAIVVVIQMHLVGIKHRFAASHTRRPDVITDRRLTQFLMRGTVLDTISAVFAIVRRAASILKEVSAAATAFQVHFTMPVRVIQPFCVSLGFSERENSKRWIGGS
jgi:hypothetical protein